jgi:shikimate dehydrogenase
VTSRTRRIVLLGSPVSHSLSPVFQNAAIRDAGINAVYEAVDVLPDRLQFVLEALREASTPGNVTIPHKPMVFGRCDELTSEARLAHTVNTFWWDNGKLCGDNTDVGGFNAAVFHLIGTIPANARVTMLGAGGAAGAVAAATSQWLGAELTVWNRTVTSAETLVQRFDHARIETSLPQAVQGADLVVNATSVGLRDDAQPVDVALLPPHAAVIDLVYRPGETAWVCAARAANHLAEDGLVMLVEQGALAFKRWFGVEPNRSVMWRAISKHLELITHSVQSA